MTESEPTIESLTELAETLHWVGTRALTDRNEAIARADKAEAELAERRASDADVRALADWADDEHEMRPTTLMLTARRVLGAKWLGGMSE